MFHVMLIPALVLLVIFAYLPMVGIVIAFQDFVPSGGGLGQFFRSEWVGLKNFQYIFGLADFRRALINTLVIAVWKIITLIIVPLILALLLNEVQSKHFKKTVQTVIYIPYFLSWVILGGILMDLLSPTDGIVNQVIMALGGESIYFLGDSKYIRGTLIISNIWKEAGYNTVIFLAALTGIDMSQYEAAKIDGAGYWKQLLHITLPRGPRLKDEFSDTIYHAGTEVPYHCHRHGFETFEVAKGSVDCVVDGRHFIAQAGDLIHLPPNTAHGFVFLEEGTIWRELFQEMDMSGGIFEKNMVNAYYAPLKEDAVFMEMYRAGKTLRREVPVAWKQPPVDHSTVFQCRTPDFAWVKYEGEGYSIQLKVCKWETAGCKEIWHADVKKGLQVDYDYPHTGYDLFYVQRGKLEVTIRNTHANAQPQTFIASNDSIIDIPSYHTYSIRVLEDSALYNYGGEYDLAACLEDLASVQENDPALLQDNDKRLAFLRHYGVYATAMTYQKD